MTQTEKLVLQQGERHNCFYLYDEKIMLERAENLKHSFAGAQLLYSIKTNPHPDVTKALFNEGFGLDAASLAEVMIGTNNGLPKQKIYYSAPGKTRRDIEVAMDKAIIIADSLNEVFLLNTIAKELGAHPKIGIRINPNFSFYTDCGAANKFGIDQDLLFDNVERIKNLSNVEFVGIHVHSKSQELDPERLKHYYDNMFHLAVTVQEKFKMSLEFINFGGGLGIDFSESDIPLDVEMVGKEMQRLMAQFKEKLPNTQILVETGRYTVGKAGIYATKVLDKKVSHGKTYIILANTLNGFVRPAMITMIEHYVGKSEDSFEPMFTKSGAFQIKVLTDKTETETVTLCGNLCAGTDVIATDITLPLIEVGDILTINNAGAYAAVMTPMQFASLTPPVQLFLTKGGIVR
ncbi:MAG: diaminopimelate decarboxylase [Oscillospiraceae bacterium]